MRDPIQEAIARLARDDDPAKRSALGTGKLSDADRAALEAAEKTWRVHADGGGLSDEQLRQLRKDAVEALARLGYSRTAWDPSP